MIINEEIHQYIQDYLDGKIGITKELNYEESYIFKEMVNKIKRKVGIKID